jgi:putative membrane protein
LAVETVLDGTAVGTLFFREENLMNKFTSRWHWTILLMSLIVNMMAISITVVILPGINILNSRLLYVGLLAIALGLLNTFLKPILQIITIRLLFVTYGITLILINTVVLLILNWLFSDLMVSGLFAAVIGGSLISLIGSFLDYIFGVMPPIGYQQALQELGDNYETT